MQCGTYSRRAACFGAVVVALSFCLCTCSVQKSGSKLNSAGANNGGNSIESRKEYSATQLKPSLKIDYLTPVNTIKNPRIYIYKEKRRLYVIESNVLVRDYPIGLGFNPKGDKEKQGDGRTPEGTFYICVKNSMSRFIQSLGLNYPSQKHAERALFAGLITPIEYRGILMSLTRKSAPPWDTKLGGRFLSMQEGPTATGLMAASLYMTAT